TSMSAPIVSGAAALLLEANPRLTPGMVRMLLQYSAQPIPGANPFEQGAGELNIEGAIRLALTLRKDVNFATASNGSTIVNAGISLPA
ncbi:S8 family serine peptidase, partial [Acinetobacter baumannii]